MALKDEIRHQKEEALKNPSLSYRIKYLLDFYKVWIIVAIVSVIVVVSIIKTVAGYRENVLNVAVINANQSVDYAAFMSDFELTEGITQKEEMSIESTYCFTGNSMADYQIEQQFYMSTAAGKIDVIIAPASYFNQYASVGYMCDYKLILDEDTLSKYKDYLLTVDVVSDIDESHTKELAGIELNEISEVIKNEWYPDTDEPVYFGITVESKNREHAMDFLSYIQK